MKILLSVTSILLVLSLLSCEKNEEKTENEYVPSQWKQQQQKIADAAVHVVVVQEVIQASSYTYLRVKEENSIFWMAITKTKVEAGETLSFEKPLEMTNFRSKELQRTFETIYFVGGISKGSTPSAPSVSEQSTAISHQKPAIENKEISIEPAEGGISIGELFSNRNSYANKTVRIKGRVTKVNQAIMGKNWVHLQDGTGDIGSNDLLVTTQDSVTPGDVVIFEGTIALNKDFGSGYSYEVIMEEAKQQAN